MSDYATSMKRKFSSEERRKSVGASEIGLCARRIGWTKSGKEPDDVVRRWGALVRGTVMEEKFWVPAMKKAYGENLLMAGRNQQTLEHDGLSATPDGIVVNQPRDALAELGIKDMKSNCFVVECKTVDPRVNLTTEKAENAYQVQVQMGLIRLLTEHKPEYAVISYTDASFWSEVTEFPIKFDPRVFATAQARAKRILQSAPEDLKPEGYISGGSECEYCAFYKSCGIIRRDVPVQEALADSQLVAEVTDLCREYVDLREQGKLVDEKVRELGLQIKDTMRSKGIRRIPKVVTWSTVKGRDSWDMAALRTAAEDKGIDVEQYRTAGEPTDRLAVSVNPTEKVLAHARKTERVER